MASYFTTSVPWLDKGHLPTGYYHYTNDVSQWYCKIKHWLPLSNNWQRYQRQYPLTTETCGTESVRVCYTGNKINRSRSVRIISNSFSDGDSGIGFFRRASLRRFDGLVRLSNRNGEYLIGWDLTTSWLPFQFRYNMGTYIFSCLPVLLFTETYDVRVSNIIAPQQKH